MLPTCTKICFDKFLLQKCIERKSGHDTNNKASLFFHFNLIFNQLDCLDYNTGLDNKLENDSSTANIQFYYSINVHSNSIWTIWAFICAISVSSLLISILARRLKVAKMIPAAKRTAKPARPMTIACVLWAARTHSPSMTVYPCGHWRQWTPSPCWSSGQEWQVWFSQNSPRSQRWQLSEPGADIWDTGQGVQTVDLGLLKWFSGQIEQAKLSSLSPVRWYPPLQVQEVLLELPGEELDPLGQGTQTVAPCSLKVLVGHSWHRLDELRNITGLHSQRDLSVTDTLFFAFLDMIYT